MRVLQFIFLLISNISVLAQTDTVIVFYDATGKVCKEDDATSFSLRTKEDDHYKKLMVNAMDNKIAWLAYFSDSDCKIFDGPYKELYKNATVKRQGYYHENKKTNTWKTWSDDGRLTDSFVYLNGYVTGIGLSWDKEGHIIDSLMFGQNGDGISHGYWSNGNFSQRGAYKQGKKDGLWTYYRSSGKKSQEVNYVADSAISYTCYDENGNLQKENCEYEKEASFPGGDKKWKQYLENKLSFINLQSSISGTVWIQFVVNSDGSIIDVEILHSVDPTLDDVFVNVIKGSPKWQHAVQFNRPVKAYRRQPFTVFRNSN
jgi:antitoxin component YwqK of YwqJK toxin-antitoxin module